MLCLHPGGALPASVLLLDVIAPEQWLSVVGARNDSAGTAVKDFLPREGGDDIYSQQLAAPLVDTEAEEVTNARVRYLLGVR